MRLASLPVGACVYSVHSLCDGRVQLFFSELTRTNIDSEAAYSLFALLCDVGGALGLILSSTVLTVCEFIDFFVLQMVVWIKVHAATVNVAH